MVLGAVLALAPAGMAYADPQDPAKVPSQQQVEDARREVDTAAGSVGRIQAQLASADARLRQLEIDAQAAAEVYNTAVYQRSQAEAAARQAAQRAEAARRASEEKRRDLARLAAATYRLDPGLTEVAAYLRADGPSGLLDQTSTVSMVSASVTDAYRSLRASQSVARVLDAEAAKAVAAQAAQTEQAAQARQRAEALAGAQAGAVAAISTEKRALVERLAELGRISVDLAAARQEGLERQAQERAEQARRQAEEQRKAEEKRKQDGDDGTGDNGSGGGGGGDTGGDGPDDGGGVPSPRQRQVALAFVLAQLGEPYVFGAAGPDTWDCSGLTMRAWEAAGISMPHFARGQYRQSRPIAMSELRAGDLIFWASNPTDSNTIYHEAMYLGGGQMVHAPRPGRNVEKRSMFYMGTPTHFARPR
ncbi:NlpC/P60 family protein [Actinopolymorpha alba]|uniref:C40 family peptidase n=1 Tax=Actinopolymorpha alba TaxID=533267 RepID=UPI000366F2B8|nr:C40 family peptidase [Actinopolymorpha alba]